MRGFQRLSDQQIGVLYGLGSSMGFGLMNFLVKLTPVSIPSSQVVFSRGILGALILTPWALKKLPLLIKKENAVLWLRFFAGGASVACLFRNLSVVGVGDASSMQNLSPFFVVLLSWILWGERLSAFEALSMALIFLGVFLLQSPQGSSLAVWDLLIGILGAFLAGVAYLALKRSAQKVSWVLVVWGFSFVSALFVLPFSAHHWVIPSVSQGMGLLAVGISGLVGQIFLTQAFIRLSPAVASALSLSSVLWGVTLEAIYFARAPKPMTLLSYVLILLGVYVLQTHPRRA
ncbi:MAG: DMT family transporter [Bdellovibrionia bacterium]